MRSVSASRVAVVLIAVLLVVRPAVAAELAAIDVSWSSFKDVEGGRLRDDAKWSVICFLGAECPLAKLYGPRLQQLSEQFSKQGVQFVGVNSNPQDSPADVKRYARVHNLTFPIVKDSGQRLARKFAATRTPEVYLLDKDRRVRYRGRVDDQYEPGVARPKPVREELRNALRAVLAGREVEVARTEPVGCKITLIRKSGDNKIAAGGGVTFAKDVAPVLNRHCVECHRPGEIGPFSLSDFDEVVGWSEMILEVVEQGRMPPWHADPKHGEFVGARTFPDAAKKTLADWVAQGMQLGDLKRLPDSPERSTGWHLPTPPDLVLPMRKRPFAVPAEGTVDYQYFVVDPQWREDRWVRAGQVMPGDASVVHHAIVFVRPPDGAASSGIGWLGGYVPGQRMASLPPGHARKIPAGSKLVFQMHYTPNGRVTEDTSKVGVWFSDVEEVTHEVTTRVALNHDFEIPPGAKEHSVDFRLGFFARDARLLSVIPHMHLRGKSFRMEVAKKDSKATLLSVPRYDFNWQHFYQLRKPLALADVDALRMRVRFDNSAANPSNPNPSDFVTWGDQTWQEMAVAFIDIGHPRGKTRVFRSIEKKKTPAEEAARRERIDREVERFLAKLDRDGDGVVRREETPDAFRRFGFNSLDRNYDGQLDRSEIEAEASRRF